MKGSAQEEEPNSRGKDGSDEKEEDARGEEQQGTRRGEEEDEGGTGPAKRELREGMKELPQRAQVARELVRTEEDFVRFLSDGIVGVHHLPFLALILLLCLDSTTHYHAHIRPLTPTQAYMQPLKQAIVAGGKGDEFGISEADIKTIFSSIKIILGFHKYTP